jgi:hypothetical protein
MKTFTRLSLARELIGGWVSFTFGVLLAVLGAVDLGISKYGSASTRARWDEAFKHPYYGWKIWVLGYAGLLVLLAFEKCYELMSELQAKLGDAQETYDRPYVVPEHWTIPLEGNAQDEVGLILKNGGKTAATNVMVQPITYKPDKESETYTYASEEIPLIGPSEKHFSVMPGALELFSFACMGGQTLPLEITYRDLKGNIYKSEYQIIFGDGWESKVSFKQKG